MAEKGTREALKVTGEVLGAPAPPPPTQPQQGRSLGGDDTQTECKWPTHKLGKKEYNPKPRSTHYPAKLLQTF